ncbi:MAG: hypothetical protein OER88_05960 [Planctomycetota bacterium]|nr:hypothetical protein [Planctomycetota bacterium]
MTDAPPPAPKAPASSSSTETTNVVVRAYPKVVYLYLTWLAALVIGFLHPSAELIDAEGAIRFTGEATSKAYTLGRIWFLIFVVNILVIAFEFSRIRSVAIVGISVGFVFAGMYFGFLEGIGAYLGGLELLMSKGFYYTFAGVFAIMYLLVFINTRFSYWEIQPNEILHHHGFLGDVHRYPTRGLRMRKEITDVFEYVLLRAGTLVITPTGVERPIFLENVIGLNRVEDKIQRLLGTMKVRIDTGVVGGVD